LNRHNIEAPNEENDPNALKQLVDYISRAMNDSIHLYQKRNIIDFDDQLWLPVVLNLNPPKYDFMFVDEAQDLNKAQYLLIEKSLTPKGRVVFIGDEFQAIYMFRAAMPDSMELCASRFNTLELPLATTYRCGKKIVEVANRMVKDLKAHESNGEGIVSYANTEQMIEKVQPGDFILSRKNAPLVSTCMKLIRAGKPANIAGRDIVEGLKIFIKKSKKRTIETFLEYVDNWEKSEISKLVNKKADESYIEAVKDKADVFRILSENKKSVDDVLKGIDSIFSNFTSDKMVVLSSTHKAKGLERDRVFMLEDTYKPNSKSVEEKNLWYVAVSRSKNELVFVKDKKI